jgi:hypothetical protein
MHNTKIDCFAKQKGNLMLWRRKFYLYLAALLMFSSRTANAGPPFITDDPEPVDYQHSEFYIATLQTQTVDGTTGTSPHVEYNYGAAPDLQLHIIIPYEFNRPADGPRQTGLGDIELGVKYRFMQETDSQPMVGIFPLIEVPSGDADKGLGNGQMQLFLPVWIQKKWGDWQTYGGGGYWMNRAADTKNHWFYGWQLQKDISEQLTLGGEIFYSTEQVPKQGASSGFNVGGNLNFDEHNHLLFSIGKGITNINLTNQRSIYLGYQWTW